MVDMCEDSPPLVVLDIELLIEEVHKRPVLWDRLSVEYNDRVLKHRLWEEVNEAVFDDWSEIGAAEKRIRSEEVKKKWRNLRDTYAKDLVIQKKVKKGTMKKKRPYRYNQELSFLHGQFAGRTSLQSSGSSDDDEKPPKKNPKPNDEPEDPYDLIINVPALISEVNNKPILWNKQSQLSECNERDVREKLWAEICGVLFDNWADLTPSAKALRYTEVKKKWRNLRDSYGRELARQRKVDLGLIKPKKPYRFFYELSFLQDTLDTSRREDDYSTPDSKVKPEVASSSYSLESEYEDSFEAAEPVSVKQEEVTAKTYDEDVCFSEMLVPMLKRLNDEQKHFAQVKILNILRRARQFDPLANIEPRTRSGVVIVKNESVN